MVQARDVSVHLHVVDVLHHVMICARGIDSVADLEAEVSAALVAGPASKAFVQAAVLVAASAAD